MARTRTSRVTGTEGHGQRPAHGQTERDRNKGTGTGTKAQGQEQSDRGTMIGRCNR